jgi:prevent-host-death family protein
MKIFTIQEAKANLSKLIKLACQGEEIVITRRSEPVVRIVPVAAVKDRQPGALRGKLRVGREFFVPLPEETLTRWE